MAIQAIPAILSAVGRIGATAARVGGAAAKKGAQEGVQTGARNAMAHLTYGAMTGTMSGRRKTEDDSTQRY